MKEMLSRLNCDEKLLAAIGSIAAESAYLERYMETMLYALTKLTRELGHPMIERGMIEGKADLLREVGRVKLKRRPQKRKRFDDIISLIKQTNSDRVTAIHGIWVSEITFPAGRGLQFGTPIASKRGKVGQDSRTMRAERAMQIATEISDAHWQLHEFAKEAWPRLFPMRVLPIVPPLGDPKHRDTRKDASKPSNPR